MTVHQFAWYPVTVERPRRGWLGIVHGARYDDVQLEVALADDYQARFFGVGKVLTQSLNEFRFLNEYDEPIVLRPTRADDAAAWDRTTLRIPLPVEIIGAIMTNSIPEPSIAAAVDDGGDVHTMVLETGMGLYARYARSWIRMTDISPIEPLSIVNVPASDLDIYDQADDQGRTVNINDLNPIEAPVISAVDVTPPAEPVQASALPILVASVDDLPTAIAHAASPEGAESRWYVGRRARALGWTDPLPWEDQ